MTDLAHIFSETADRIDGSPVIALWGSEEPGDARDISLRELGWHSHTRGQFLSVEAGLVRIRSQAGSWALPPRRVGWVPPGEPHEVSVSGTLIGWGAMLSPAASEGLLAHWSTSRLLDAKPRSGVVFNSPSICRDSPARSPFDGPHETRCTTGAGRPQRTTG
jgi:hypothetical protein